MKPLSWIIAFDPGVSTGISMGRFSENRPFEHVNSWQVSGGLMGLILGKYLEDFREDSSGNEYHIISEKFVPLSGGGFHHTLDSVEPLRIEGALIARGLMPDYPDPRWQRASSQVIKGGRTPAERKKNSDNLLREHGMWMTGKDVWQPDANDANSATKHILWYMKNTLKHEPTIKEFWPDEF